MSTSFPTLNLDEFGSAIANAEGYGVPGAIPTEANNPGDLALGDIGYGTLGNNITVFPSASAGADALTNQENLISNGESANYSSGESIADMGTTYAGASGGSTWAANVAKFLGVSPNTPIGSLLAGAAMQTAGLNPSNQYLTAAGVAGGTSSPITNIVFVVLGIMLIGIGAFSFKGTQTIIQTAGNVAKVAA